jgi:hypothetical protein
MRENMQYLSLWGWLISLNMSPVPSTFLQITKFHSFLWPNITSLCIYVYHFFFIHSSTDKHLGWFHNLSTINSTVTIWVCRFLYSK